MSAKSTLEHWRDRIFHRKFTGSDGVEHETPDWYVRIWMGGDIFLRLEKTDRNEAAAKAREIWLHYKANGREATLAKYKPRPEVKPEDPEDNTETVGGYCRAVRGLGIFDLTTLSQYEGALRLIASQLFGLNRRLANTDERVDKIKLSKLTEVRINRWAAEKLDAAEDREELASIRRTLNTNIGRAKSMFSRKVRKLLKHVVLPSPLPFTDAPRFPGGSTAYHSQLDAQLGAIVQAARTELKTADPEAYKAFLLGLFAGLRKAEVDKLEWRAFDWQENAIDVQETGHLKLKTANATRRMLLPPAAIVELKEMFALSKSKFVLDGDAPVQVKGRYIYRAQPTFDRLYAWIRKRGIETRKPFHELRKEGGYQMAKAHGIYAAATWLGDTVKVTEKHYVDRTNRVALPLGNLLQPEPTILEKVVDGSGQ